MIASSTIICVTVVGFCSKGNTLGACKRTIQGQSHTPMQDQSVQQNRSDEYIDVIEENAYESIEEVSADETPISGEVYDNNDNNIPIDIDQNSTLTSSNECVIIIDDSYQYPYNPLHDHIEKHDYKNIEPKLDIVVGKEDTSRDSDKNSTDSSGYLIPVKIEKTVI